MAAVSLTAGLDLTKLSTEVSTARHVPSTVWPVEMETRQTAPNVIQQALSHLMAPAEQQTAHLLYLQPSSTPAIPATSHANSATLRTRDINASDVLKADGSNRTVYARSNVLLVSTTPKQRTPAIDATAAAATAQQELKLIVLLVHRASI